MGAAEKPLTFDEMYAAINALPEGQHGEILGPGDWRAMSRPGAAHRRASRALTRIVDSLQRDGGWWFEVETELLLADHLYVPDLAGWRVVDGDLGFVDRNPVARTPGWACEILSRGTQRGDRVLKLPTYAAAGVRHVWIVDAEGETIEVYESPNGLPTLIATAAAHPARLPPFDLEIDAPALFALPR